MRLLLTVARETKYISGAHKAKLQGMAKQTIRFAGQPEPVAHCCHRVKEELNVKLA